jgi:hypothetical protein
MFRPFVIILSFFLINQTSGCGRDFTGESFGNFSTPNYPSNYPNSVSCTWFINVTAGNLVELYIGNFISEQNYDFLLVRDGPNNTSPVIGQYSGSARPGYIYSSTGYLLVQFNSDGSNTAQGFTAIFQTVPVEKCGHYFGQGPGSFASPNYPSNYPNSVDCYWHINVLNDHVVQLSIPTFKTENRYDTLDIRDGRNSSSPLIGQYSGTAIPGNITSTGNSLWLWFHSDLTTNEQGFAANYSAGAVSNAKLGN